MVSSEPWSADGAVVIVDGDLDVETAPQLEEQISRSSGTGTDGS